MLVDPPFEAAGEYERLVRGLQKAHERWPTGVYLLWYAVKDLAAVGAFERALAASGVPKILRAELFVRKRTGATFDGCSLAIVNGPFTLEADLARLLPYLAAALAQGSGAGHRLDWLTEPPR